ncbi:MAG: LacI family DNA-binding transcriptional regulator [Lentilitoribacter sp.]
MSKQPLPKLEDVARLAGVSTATVSRCLNQPNQVIEATRKRVQKAVDELGYMPNFNARSLAAKRSKIIGAVIPTMENAIFARALQVFQERLTEEDFDLLVASSSYKKDVEEKQIRSLVSRGVDGLLLIGIKRDPKIYEFLQEREIPFVIAWSFDEHMKAPVSGQLVGFNNYKAMASIVQLVLDKGHRNIAMLAGIADNNDRASARIAGFKAKTAEYGLKDPIVLECEYDIDKARKAFANLHQTLKTPTALICANDVLAVGAVLEAQSQGLNVPDDISITGFDDIEIASIISPSLTTVHVPHRMLGLHSANTLLANINAGRIVTDMELETSIIERQSLSNPKV